MKNLLALAIAGMLSTGCSPQTIDAGEEAVLIEQPWFFGHGGVVDTPVKTGQIWTVWSTSVVRYNVKPVKYKERFVDLTASDNVAIDFDAYITLTVEQGKTPVLHEDSGQKWYENRVADVFRKVVRNEARTRSSIELRTKPDIIEASQHAITEKMNAYIQSIQLPVTISKVVIGKVVPPNEVLTEAAETAAQKQRIKTQVARAKAEESRTKAEQNKALADLAFAKEFNMTTDQFLHNKKLDIMQEALKAGNVSIILNASDAKPMLQVKR